jgi:hypothetical protein
MFFGFGEPQNYHDFLIFFYHDFMTVINVHVLVENTEGG